MKNISKYMFEKLIINKDVEVTMPVMEKIKIIRNTIKNVIKSINYGASSYDTILADGEGFSTSNYDEVKRVTLQFNEPLRSDTEKLKEIKELLIKELPQKAYSKIEEKTNTISQKPKYVIYL